MGYHNITPNVPETGHDGGGHGQELGSWSLEWICRGMGTTMLLVGEREPIALFPMRSGGLNLWKLIFDVIKVGS